MNYQTKRRQFTFLTIASLLVLFGFASSVFAQSGRRISNSKPIVVPTPEPSPTPTPVPKPTPAFSIAVGVDSDSFSGVPVYYNGIALDACAERIAQSALVEVVGRNVRMSRAEAIKAAKGGKAYVVWLQLRGESVGADHSVHNISEVYVEYTLYAPQTAKMVTSGRTYQRALRKGGVIVSPPTGRTTGVYAELLIREAARDAGQRILSALPVPTGRTVPP